MTPAPIALFVYNRLGHTEATITSLQKNILAAETDLFIFSDGSSAPTHEAQVSEVRKYLSTVNGFKKIEINERDKNYGLARNIIDGVTSVVSRYNKIIVVEDDMVTSPYFLQYMNDALDHYENNEQVACINGYVYPVKESLPETFFLRGADCWGWATWKRSWDLFEPDGKKLLDELLKRDLMTQFDYDGSYSLTRMLENQIKGKNNSWAIRWQASAFIRNKLTLYPGKSLVQNIGNDGSGVHSGSSDIFDVKLSDSKVTVSDIPVEVNDFCRTSFVKYFNSIKPGLLKRIYYKLKTAGKNVILKKSETLG